MLSFIGVGDEKVFNLKRRDKLIEKKKNLLVKDFSLVFRGIHLILNLSGQVPIVYLSMDYSLYAITYHFRTNILHRVLAAIVLH